MLPLPIRRAIVFVAAVAALYGGAFAIRSAAGWTGQSQPLAEAPPDAAALVAQLVDERGRAQPLSGQLQQAMARSQELEDALAAATSKAAHDAKSAQHLASQLDSARARLEELQRQLADRPAPTVTVTVPAPAATAAPTTGGGGYEGDDDGEHGGDD
jgi:hypothetical protein